MYLCIYAKKNLSQTERKKKKNNIINMLIKFIMSFSKFYAYIYFFENKTTKSSYISFNQTLNKNKTEQII